jgi:hemerythrin
MPLMQWSQKLSVGVHQFDLEHQRLVSMLNELFDAAQTGKAQGMLGDILDQMVSYTQTHFINEERFMEQHQVPGLKEHRQEHAILAHQVIEVQRKYHAGAGISLSMEVLDFLKNWLLKHILGTDKKYGSFVNAHGAKAVH